MDTVDFDHELGNCETTVYDSLWRIENYAKSKCWKYCGVVKFKVKILDVEEVVPQDLFNPKNLVTYKPGKNGRYKKQANRNGSKTRRKL